MNKESKPKKAKDLLSIIGRPKSEAQLPEKSDKAAFLGAILRRSRSDKMVEDLGRACQEQASAPSYIATTEGGAALQTILDYLEKDLPDETKFNALKRLFQIAAENSESEDARRKHLLYIRACRNIEPTEIVILKSIFEANQSTPISIKNDIHGFDMWSQFVSEKTGGQIPIGIFWSYDQQMINHNLVSDRTDADRSGIRGRSTLRLTPFGIELATLLAE